MVDHRPGLNTLEKGKISHPCQESGHNSSVVQPIAYSLSWLTQTSNCSNPSTQHIQHWLVMKQRTRMRQKEWLTARMGQESSPGIRPVRNQQNRREKWFYMGDKKRKQWRNGSPWVTNRAWRKGVRNKNV